jgi:hypothetical protein
MQTPSRQRRSRVPGAVAAIAVAVAVSAVPRSATALFDAGAQLGIVERSASAPSGLKIGVGFGWHGDVDLLPLVKLGPYLLHYDLSANGGPDPRGADASFNALGLRTSARVPITARFRSQLAVGLGYTSVRYLAPVLRSGRFWECPIALGIGYEAGDRVDLSLDVAYRPGFAFGGRAFDVDPAVAHPSTGWSLLLGATVNF